MTTAVHREVVVGAAVQQAWRRIARVVLLVGGGLVVAGLAALLAAPILPGESINQASVLLVAVVGVGGGVSVLVADAVWLALRGLVRPLYSLKRKRTLFWLTLAASALFVLPLCVAAFGVGLLALFLFPLLALVVLLVAAVIFAFGWYFTRQ